LSNLPDEEKYLIESFVDEHSGNTDHARSYQTAIERLEHVKKCIADKGYVELRGNIKGKWNVWKTWIEHLETKNYLMETKIETGRRSKKVYKIAESNITDNKTKI